MTQKQIVLNEQAIKAFDNLLLNYRFIASNNQIDLYWQPYTDKVDEGITIEDKLETILQQNKIEVDSLYYISPQHTFLDVIKWYKQRITITYSCIKCDAGRDICFNADEKIPTLIKAFCPICESDLILKEHTKPIEVKCSLKYVLDKYLYLVQEYIKSDYSIEKSAQIS